MTEPDNENLPNNHLESNREDDSFTFTPIKTGHDTFNYTTPSNLLFSITAHVDDHEIQTEEEVESISIQSGAYKGATATMTRAPLHGEASLTSEGSLCYLPNPGHTGIDFVGYTITTDTAKRSIRLIIQAIPSHNLAVNPDKPLPSNDKPLTDETLVDEAKTIAAFALASQDSDFPVGNTENANGEAGENDAKDYIQEALNYLLDNPTLE